MTRPILAAAVITAGFLFTAPALATGGGDKPGCHGQNQEDCRPDPNPSGKDCDPHGKGGINDDHCATTTSSSTTTSTLPGLSPTTTATTAAPTTTTTTVGAVPKDSSVTVYGVNESRRQRRLADTGSPAVFYAVIALFAVAFGLALRYVGRLGHPSDG